MSGNKSSKLKEKILSASEKELVKYLDETILNLNTNNSTSLLDNLAEVNQLDLATKNIAIARMDQIKYSYESFSKMSAVLSIMITILTFVFKTMISHVGFSKSFGIYFLFLLGSIYFLGINLLKQKKRVVTAVYFKTFLEKNIEEDF